MSLSSSVRPEVVVAVSGDDGPSSPLGVPVFYDAFPLLSMTYLREVGMYMGRSPSVPCVAIIHEGAIVFPH